MWKYVIMLAIMFLSAKARPQQGGSYIGVNDYSFSYGSKDGVHKLQAQMFNGKWQVRGSFSWIGNDGKMYTTNFIVDPQGYRSGVIDGGFTTTTTTTTEEPIGVFGAFGLVTPQGPGAEPGPLPISSGTVASTLGIGK